MLHVHDDADALAALLEFSRWNVDVGREVVAALDALGDRAVPALARRLADRQADPIARMTSARLLGRIGGRDAARALCGSSADADVDLVAQVRAS